MKSIYFILLISLFNIFFNKKLISVVILARHGARNPAYSLNYYNFSNL